MPHGAGAPEVDLRAHARRRLLVALLVHHGERGADVVHDRILHRQLQPAALARRPLLVERAEDADRHQHAGAGVADRRARLARLAAGFAGDAHRAAAGLRDHVEGERFLVRAALAEALDLAVDDAGVDLLQHVVAEAEALDRAGGEVLGEHVGLLDQLLDEPHALRGLEIDRRRLLVGVEDLEIERIGILGSAAAMRRPGSPLFGFSILTTSAPSQASASVQVGPASNWVRSTTRTPLQAVKRREISTHS